MYGSKWNKKDIIIGLIWIVVLHNNWFLQNLPDHHSINGLLRINYKLMSLVPEMFEVFMLTFVQLPDFLISYIQNI